MRTTILVCTVRLYTVSVLPRSHTVPVNSRPQFMAMYFSEPDHSGHEGGPESDKVLLRSHSQTLLCTE